MSNEFVYVVVDVGSRYTRAGVSGMPRPMVTLVNDHNPPRDLSPPFLELDNHALTSDQKTQLWAQVQNSALYGRLVRTYKDDTAQWVKLDGGDDMERSLHRRFAEIFSVVLTPLNRTRIMIVDNELSIMNKMVMSKLLVVNIGVKSVQFLPKPVMACISANTADGLVVDIGWSSARISPVMDHRVLQELVSEDSRLTGSALHYKIVERLIEMDSSVVERDDLFDVVDRFVRGCVYVRDDDEAADDIEVDGIVLPGHLKYSAVEEVFFGANSIVDHVKRVLERAPIDVRPVLQRSVVFDGGVFEIPGMKQRLLRELGATALCSLGAWAGASVYSSTSLNKRTRSLRKTQEITKESIKQMWTEHGLKMTQFVDRVNQ